MLKKLLKRLFYKTFTGIAFPVFSKQLKGLHLAVDPLMPTFHFWKDVDIESHFVYDKVIKKGFVVFDVGGNVGLHSYYFATKFPDTSVYAFEPLPENVSYLKRMVKLNKLTNITVIEKAIAAQSGAIYFDRDKNNHQGHISTVVSDLSVQAVTLDDFIEQSKIAPDFIKIDVEGFEADVLDGFHETIRATMPSIIIELHSVEQGKRLADFFRPLNYRIFQLQNIKTWHANKPLTEVINDVENGELPHGFWGTVLAIPADKAAEYSSLFSGSFQPYRHIAT